MYTACSHNSDSRQSLWQRRTHPLSWAALASNQVFFIMLHRRESARCWWCGNYWSCFSMIYIFSLLKTLWFAKLTSKAKRKSSAAACLPPSLQNCTQIRHSLSSVCIVYQKPIEKTSSRAFLSNNFAREYVCRRASTKQAQKLLFFNCDDLDRMYVFQSI